MPYKKRCKAISRIKMRIFIFEKIIIINNLKIIMKIMIKNMKKRLRLSKYLIE